MQSQEETSWMKLPSQLQHEFFRDAEKEAEKVKKVLAQRLQKLDTLKRLVKTAPIPKNDELKKLRIAAVDGSNSPTTSERLGVRYGAYAAGYMVFEGSKVVDEAYRSGSFSQDQITDRDVAQKTLSLLRMKLERDVALHCLEDVDYVLIDGSFFGFRAEAIAINDREIGIEGYEDGKELTREVAEKSWKLLKTGKVAGVIKRTRTSVIDGWITKEYGTTAECMNMNDKYIMTYLLPIGHWFDFGNLLEKRFYHNYYARFRSIYRQIVEREKKQVPIEKIFDSTKRDFEHNTYRLLGLTSELIRQSARYFARCSASPPFEFEVHEDVDVMPLLSYFMNFHNPATGLPWPIDLIDANVSVPQGFTKEFVDEVQARLLHDPEMSDKLKLMEFFSYLNPQKEEE
jgi:hypothetical protein